MQTLLMIGCGDIARRAVPHLLGRYRIFALLRDSDDPAFWRNSGIVPIAGDLDLASKMARIRGLADNVLYFAPPQKQGMNDRRIRRALARLAQGKKRVKRFVYISTCGVYGDARGEWLDETARIRPQSDRARRRADAERALRRFAACSGVCASILRAPGIYAADRLPLDRLRQGLPVLNEEDDVYTNHIHADDLAKLACNALRYGLPNRCYNAVDDSRLKMGDFFDLLADRLGLPRPPRVSRREAQQRLSSSRLSFIGESRRIGNHRIKTELKAQLRFPRVNEGIGHVLS